MNISPVPALAVVGAGPRGISVIERIAAALRERPTPTPLTIHVIDDAEHGAGRIWETDQSRTLCMNTLAARVTLFTEPGSTVTAPVVEGPTQYEWIQLLRGQREEVAPAKVELFDAHPPAPDVAEDFRHEIAVTRPESNPSRALYGAYLRWVYDVARARLPEGVELVSHHSRAVGISENGGRDEITLADGSVVTADAVVLATGWTVPGPDAEERRLAAAGPTWIRPDNPLDQDLSVVPAGENVLVRGLGMGFFDVMALLTVDRGGRFIDDPAARSGLRYEPSGREPKLVVSSGRGYPYLPKSDFGGLPPGSRITRLRAAIEKLKGAGEQGVDFDAQVWPAIVRDAYEAYYRVLSRVRPSSVRTSYEVIVAVIDATSPAELDEALARHSTEPFSLRPWAQPLAGVSGSVDGVTALIADRLVDDIAQAALGRDSPLKAALWSVSVSRKPAQILGAEGRYTWASRANTFATMMAIGQMAGSGPPLFRTRQLLALVDAGLVRFLGARPRLDVRDGVWVMSSPTTGGEEVAAATLLDAWMHKPDVRPADGDPLWSSLGERIRPFGPTGSPEVDPATRRCVGVSGERDPRLHVIGIPTHGQLPDTTISPMPGTDPLMLQETDKTALSLLASAGI